MQFPGQEHVYLVGTESGCVHECSKAYGSGYLASFTGHHMPVYAVRWNSMHPGMFLSCSADWTVQVREHGRREGSCSTSINSGRAAVLHDSSGARSAV